MKTYFLALLLCCFTLSALGQDINPARFSGCSDEEMSILHDELIHSETIVAGLKDDVAQAKIDFPSEKSALNRVNEALDCIARKLPGIRVKCDNLNGAHGITFPLIGNRVALDHEAISRISLNGENYTSAVLIHEVSHKCGMTDGTYFHHSPAPGPSNWGLLSWTRIASSYQYWVMWGFCVPGQNCPAN